MILKLKRSYGTLKMRTIILFFGLLATCIHVSKAQSSCDKKNSKIPTGNYIDLIHKLKLCDFDTTIQKDDYLYGYCDSNFYNVYNLSLPKESAKLLLIEVTNSTGTDGYDYYIVIENNQKIEKLNFFKGFLECIKPISGNSANIVFYTLTDHGKIKVLLGRKGTYYHRNNILDVIGTDVNQQNKDVLLKKYRAEDETKYVTIWEE